MNLRFDEEMWRAVLDEVSLERFRDYGIGVEGKEDSY